MFPELGEQECERVKEVINRLLAVNFLIKERERELYLQARRYRESITSFFTFLGWEILFDERHECIFVATPESSLWRNLTRDESIWLLVLRLLYQEKRQGLSLSEFPLVTLNEIRSKYLTFRLPMFNKTNLQKLVKLGTQNSLLEVIGEEIYTDEAVFRLYHTMLYVVRVEQVEKLQRLLMGYERKKEEGLEDEMAEAAATG